MASLQSPPFRNIPSLIRAISVAPVFINQVKRRANVKKDKEKALDTIMKSIKNDLLMENKEAILNDEIDFEDLYRIYLNRLKGNISND